MAKYIVEAEFPVSGWQRWGNRSYKTKKGAESFVNVERQRFKDIDTKFRVKKVIKVPKQSPAMTIISLKKLM